MKKTLIAATILLTASLLICGMFFPNVSLMWLAGTSLSFEIARAVLIVLLTILLFSNPPRALYFRYGIAAVAVLLTVAVGVLIVNYKINVIDIIVFMEVAVILGVEALEAPEEYMVALRSSKRTTALSE